jgi:hypothetical protein
LSSPRTGRGSQLSDNQRAAFGSPACFSDHADVRTEATAPAAVPRTDEVGLLAVGPLEPLVIAACRDDAPIALEGVTEHRLCGDSLRSRVKARWQFLQCLIPPPGNEPPAHGDQLARAFGRGPHDIDRVSRRDVVVGLQVASGAIREFVQVVDFVRGAAFADRTFTPLTRGAMPLRNRTCARSVCGSRTAKCCSRRTLPRQTAAARCGESYRSPSTPR